MQKYEQYKRLLRFLLSLLFTAAQAGMFYYTWMAYYNELMESPFQRKGNWLMAAFYTLLLLLFAYMGPDLYPADVGKYEPEGI